MCQLITLGVDGISTSGCVSFDLILLFPSGLIAPISIAQVWDEVNARIQTMDIRQGREPLLFLRCETELPLRVFLFRGAPDGMAEARRQFGPAILLSCRERAVIVGAASRGVRTH